MNRAASKRFRAHDSRRDPDDSTAKVPPRAADTAELEGQLAQALEALARQKQESEENATSFAQAMARLSHSERTLGQTKARLMDANERGEKGEARVAALSEQLNLHGVEISRLQQALEAAQARELEQGLLLETLRAQNETKARELEDAHEWKSRAVAQERALRDLAESLSRDSADGAAECARLDEHCKAAEEREQRAIERALQAESAHSSAVTELSESRRREAELLVQCAELQQARDAAQVSLAGAQASIAEREVERALAQQELASADQERARFIGILGALEVLGREIVEVGFHARKAAETRSNVQFAQSECDRPTLKPEPAPKLARSLRSSTAPEITVDGVRLDA